MEKDICEEMEDLNFSLLSAKNGMYLAVSFAFTSELDAPCWSLMEKRLMEKDLRFVGIRQNVMVKVLCLGRWI